MRTKLTKSGHHVWSIPAIEMCTKTATPERKKLTVSKILQYVRMDRSLIAVYIECTWVANEDIILHVYSKHANYYKSTQVYLCFDYYIF